MENNVNVKEKMEFKTAPFQKFALGLQHLIAMFGATVLVPILTGLDISVALFCAGFGTLIFHFCTKWKVPVFLGSSFAFIPVIQAVGAAYGDLRYAQGGIIMAGLCYVLLSFFVLKFGVDKIKAFFPPRVIGPMIIVIGTNLIPVAKGMAQADYTLAGVTLIVALAIMFLTKGFLKQLSIIIGVSAGYILALATQKVDLNIIADAKFFEIPHFSLPIFDIGAILMIVPVVLAVFMEHIGDITTNGAVVGKNFMEDPGLNRTLMGDGLATVFAGFLGAPANTTYGENTGVLAITKNYDPSILRITAVIAVIISFVGKLGGVLKSIPVPVMGGISLLLFSMIAIIGVKTLINSNTKVEWKNIVVILSVLVIGLGSHFGLNLSIPITQQIGISGLSLAAIVGVVLSKVFNLIE